MSHEKITELCQALADYLDVDEAEVIVNEDEETFIVGDSCYLVWELKMKFPDYKYCIIPVL